MSEDLDEDADEVGPGASPDPYDRTPYGGTPVPVSHPDRLALAAARAGLSPPEVASARILELGCGDGANLVPMAYRLEAAELVGLDASAGQLEVAREAKARLGLDNLELREARIEAVEPASLGTFDYVIAHGVLSWVAEEVAERLWALIAATLRPNGVAFVSFNCAPGWAIRHEMRRALLAHVHDVDAPDAALRARALLASFAESPAAALPYGALLAEEARRVLARSDGYLRHEYLAEHNRAYRWGEILDATGRHGLAPLAELGHATPDRAGEDALGEQIRGQLDDPARAEELTELLVFRAFRMTSFVHADALPAERRPVVAAFAKAGHWAARLRPQERRPSLDPGVAERFADEDGVAIASEDPWLKAALLELSRSWPAPVAFAELVERASTLLEARRVRAPGAGVEPHVADALAGDLMQLAHLGQVQRTSVPPTVARTSETPRVAALTRWEASRRANVAGAYHRVAVLDPLARGLVRHCDGSRDGAALVRAARALLDDGEVVLRNDDGEPLPPEEAAELLPDLVQRSVAALADAGLLER